MCARYLSGTGRGQKASDPLEMELNAGPQQGELMPLIARFYNPLSPCHKYISSDKASPT